MPKPDFSNPESVVKAFIQTMYCWESLAATLAQGVESRFGGEDSSTMAPEEMEFRKPVLEIPLAIVATYLTKRPHTYTPSRSYSIPPSYDPKQEKVVRVVPKTASQVMVETLRKSPFGPEPREYIVKKQEGRWLIDSVTVTIGNKKMKNVLV